MPEVGRFRIDNRFLDEPLSLRLPDL